jgi:hypothetical protein
MKFTIREWLLIQRGLVEMLTNDAFRDVLDDDEVEKVRGIFDKINNAKIG